MKSALTITAALAIASCSPHPAPITSDHPASPDAPTGRLSGPPAALRPGVVSVTEPSVTEPSMPDRTPMTGHEHHMPSPDSQPASTEPATPQKAPKEPAAPQPATAKKPPDPKKASNPKPAPKPEPTPDPHQGHDMDHH